MEPIFWKRERKKEACERSETFKVYIVFTFHQKHDEPQCSQHVITALETERGVWGE